jgi:hypothetical protein
MAGINKVKITNKKSSVDEIFLLNKVDTYPATEINNKGPVCLNKVFAEINNQPYLDPEETNDLLKNGNIIKTNSIKGITYTEYLYKNDEYLDLCTNNRDK